MNVQKHKQSLNKRGDFRLEVQTKEVEIWVSWIVSELYIHNTFINNFKTTYLLMTRVLLDLYTKDRMTSSYKMIFQLIFCLSTIVEKS